MNRFSYQMYEMAHLAVAPARAMSDAMRLMFKNPLNPFTHTPLGRNMAASAELFERLTRRYGKPSFDLPTTTVGDKVVDVHEEIVWEKPFCQVIHFRRQTERRDPRLLIVAPQSGHYATLLRGTVEAFLPHFDVYITDWTDARMVPLSVGRFDLDDYIDYLVEISRFLGCDAPGAGLHTLGVCQPSVPLIAAVALMEAAGDPLAPASMTLMGGPIDTRRSPTAVNTLAQQRGINWFKRNCIVHVPFPYPGVAREVYPGFLQLSGFMAMNLDRHVNAHLVMFNPLVEGDGDSADSKKAFYDEYRAVCDMTAEFYLQTIEHVFQLHSLPKGELMHRGAPVDLGAITDTAILAIEGENDDISGIGQTRAALKQTTALDDSRKQYLLAPEVGHYGIFNGTRWRTRIAPVVEQFIAAHRAREAAPA